MKVYNKVILPLGFKANGASSGIKKSGKLDLALFYSEQPAKAACLFTANTIKAAPIQINQQYLKNNHSYRGIIANSGNANCFTGKSGLIAAERMTEYTAKALGVASEEVLVASTGIIARKFPLQKIKQGMPELISGLSAQGIDKAKKAIMTTDTFSKEITARFNIGKRCVTVCGVAKGAGMIAPNMATMLVFLFTDADITQKALKAALRGAVDNSFNCLTIDGCMSTNDMVIMLANGMAQNVLINSGKGFNLFAQALNAVCLRLAKLIIRDAEGATKFIRINVHHAKTAQEAKKIALCVANSNLFKTAIYAESPNFLGRVIASVGASGINIKENDLKVRISPLNKKDITLDISVKRGNFRSTIYTADLTHGYIKINAEYN